MSARSLCPPRHSLNADRGRRPEELAVINAKIDEKGRLGSVASFREQLKIDELETTAEGQRKAERIWRRKFNKNSPLACSSPAIADGRIYIRVRNGIACYDLRQ